MRRRTAGAPIAVATIGISVVATPYALAATSDESTRLVQSRREVAPALPGRDQVLSGVDAAASDDAWAVGSHARNTAPRCLVLHYDGDAWTKVPSPNPGTSENGLSGVSVLTADDVWAVGGSSDTGDHHTSTLALHWDGAEWSRVPAQSPAAAANSFGDVAALSPSDVWAVGSVTQTFEGTFDGLIEHWDGTTWDVVPFPDLPGPGSLDGVSGSGPDDVWAVGHAGVRGRNVPVIDHFNGHKWVVVPPAPLRADSLLRDVTALSPSDAWAVGLRTDRTGVHTLVEHWNGSDWAIVDSADPSGRDSLRGIDARTESDIWAVGDSHVGAVSEPLTEHWDGKTWTSVPVRPPSSESRLGGVAAVSPTTAFAVGTVIVNPSQDRSLLERWDGVRWSRLRSD